MLVAAEGAFLICLGFEIRVCGTCGAHIPHSPCKPSKTPFARPRSAPRELQNRNDAAELRALGEPLYGTRMTSRRLRLSGEQKILHEGDSYLHVVPNKRCGELGDRESDALPLVELLG